MKNPLGQCGPGHSVKTPARKFGEGGRIDGPGTPTSDSIQAKVVETGEPIAVSTGERIVSKEQDAVLEMLARELGYESLDALLAAETGLPVGPTVKGGQKAAAFGDKIEDVDYQQATTATIGNQPKPEPMAAMPDVLRAGNSFSQAPGASAAPEAGNPLPEVKPAAPVIDKNGNNMAFTNSMKAQLGESPIAAATAPSPTIRDKFGNDMTQTNAMKAQLAETPTNPIRDMGRDFSMPEGRPMPFTPRVEAPTPSKAPTFQSGDASMQAADPKGYAQVAGTQPGAQERLFAAGTPLPSSASPLAAPTAPTATQPPASIPASTPYVDGSQAIKPANPLSSVAPFSARNGNSFTERNTGEDKSNPLTSINMTANNESMARANAIRQSMIDGENGAPSVTRLGDSGRAESQALMDKWERQHAANTAMSMAANNPKSGQAIASVFNAANNGEASIMRNTVDRANHVEANATTQRGQDNALSTATMNADVQKRGQDIDAKTRAAQLAGNPLTNELTRVQTQVAQNGLDDRQKTSAALAEMQKPETTPERRKVLMQSVLAAQGKTLNENRYIPHNTKTYNDMGQVTGETAMMFDKETGQDVTPQGSPARVDPLPPKSDLKVGQVYSTRNGPAMWDGSNFVPVKS